MSANKNQRGLGRGLSALLADSNVEAVTQYSSPEGEKEATTLPIEFLEANPDQPRKRFAPDELEELTSSIKERGMIQPILVRKISEDRYQIVAGERRWRAAGLAKLHRVPVVVREYSDQDVAEIALIENIQRADLNPLEEASGYNDLIKRYSYTQEELSQVLGKSRSHIANMIRLMQLEESVQVMVRDGRLSMGHARALVTSSQQLQDAQKVVASEMSVRELEKMLESRRMPKGEQPTQPQGSNPKDADTKQLESELSANLGAKVQIDHNENGSGKLSIKYKNMEMLDQIVKLLGQ